MRGPGASRRRAIPTSKVALAMLLVGCESATVCTERGCVGGLLVRLDSRSPVVYRLEVWSEESPSRTFDCAGYCGEAFFPGFEGEHVTVRITSRAGAEREQQFRVTPAPVYPNGHRCGIGCYQATISVEP